MRSNTDRVKRPRWKRLAQNLALMSATLLLCFAMLEVVLRLRGYGNLVIYEPDPGLFWKTKANQDCYTKVGRKPVHINSHGTRGPEFEMPKPDKTIRILSLGDSKTFGWGLTEAETYSGVLEAQLQERVGPSRKVEVINAGVNAWSYPQMEVYFRELGLKFEPDYVILADANLWTQFSESSSPEFAKKFMSRVRLKNFLRRFAAYHYFIEVQLKDFYARYRVKFIPVNPEQDTLFKDEQQSDPDAVFRESIERLCGLAKTNGVRPILVFIPTLDDLDSTNRSRVVSAKESVSERLDVPLVDMTEDLSTRGEDLYLEADPVHLNVSGNKLVASRLFEIIDPILNSK